MQTLYAQVQVSKIGSLSYAEDDGSHVIGLKVADPFDADSYACHVVECSSEVCAWAYVDRTCMLCSGCTGD